MTKKPYPTFENDDEEQAFLDTANLEEYELTTGGVPMRQWLAGYEDMDKDARVNLRLPKALVLEFKRKAAERRMPYQRLMRAVLQQAAKTL
jgi:predicted DNA binding CopG/RHH family protein